MDPSGYCNFLRMDSTSFEELLQSVGPAITYQDTIFRKAIPAAERLALTLRFVATGKYYLYRLSQICLFWKPVMIILRLFFNSEVYIYTNM